MCVRASYQDTNGSVICSVCQHYMENVFSARRAHQQAREYEYWNEKSGIGVRSNVRTLYIAMLLIREPFLVFTIFEHFLSVYFLMTEQFSGRMMAGILFNCWKNVKRPEQQRESECLRFGNCVLIAFNHQGLFILKHRYPPKARSEKYRNHKADPSIWTRIMCVNFLHFASVLN